MKVVKVKENGNVERNERRDVYYTQRENPYRCPADF